MAKIVMNYFENNLIATEELKNKIRLRMGYIDDIILIC